MNEFILNPDQNRAFERILAFIAANKGNPTKFITLGGFAGTGKTTLISKIAANLKQGGNKLAFCTISGKASSVLRSKLAYAIDEKDYCGTVHGFIYKYCGKCDETNRAIFENKATDNTYDVVFIDEASMVNKYIFDDIMDIPNAVKIFVGDHGQLPPVEGSFNIMEDPHIRLETIVRQAEDNPIIRVSMMAREEGRIPYDDWGAVLKTHDGSIISKFDLNHDDVMVLVATNRDRQRINSFAREKYGFDRSYPMNGEKIVCLMNDKKRNIFNGQIGRVSSSLGVSELIEAKIRVFDKDLEVWQDEYRMTECCPVDFTIKDDERNFKSKFLMMQFGHQKTLERSDDYNLFDFGYCLTTHKAQGSEWETVIVYENGYQWIRDWNRWLYTAVTRAKQKLIIIKK